MIEKILKAVFLMGKKRSFQSFIATTSEGYLGRVTGPQIGEYVANIKVRPKNHSLDLTTFMSMQSFSVYFSVVFCHVFRRLRFGESNTYAYCRL